MWGVAEAVREEICTVFSPAERRLFDPVISAARADLGEEAWRTAFAQGQAMTPERATAYARSEEEPGVPAAGEPPAILTRREKEVAALVARGITNRRIASELVLSERTVDNHVANIFKKLGVRSRDQVSDRLAG